MTEAEGGSHGKSPEFDFNLAEKEIREIETLETWFGGRETREGSSATYEPYGYVQDNKVPNSDPRTGESNSGV